MPDFYEKVLVLDTADEPELRGRFGYVIGTSEEDGIVHQYAVVFDGDEHMVLMTPEQIAGTGQIEARERFFSDATIRVRVDEQGRGHIVG
jgi:hypothetical protein